MAAKNWWDTAAPTMEMGGLLGMPSMSPTEEDKRQALKQMLMQMGMGMVANSHKGNQAALGAGLLGGVQGYQQGMQGPMNRFEMAKQQLDFQGKQLGNAKTGEELAKMKREAGDYAKQNDFFSTLTNPAALSMMGGGGPTNAALDRASQFASNPAAALSDPNVNLRALAARVDPKQLGAALENTRPFAMDAGKTYQYGDGRERYIPKLGEGIRPTANGGAEMMPGYDVAQNRMNYASKSGDLAAQLNYDRAKLPFDVQRAGGVADAEASARDKYNFQTITDENGDPYAMTNPQARARMTTNSFPGARVPPAQQAQRDQVRRQILADEGQDPNTPTRINDNPGAGFAPQLNGLSGIKGQSAANKVQGDELAKGYAKVYEDLRTKATDLNSIMGKYRQIESILGDFEGGKLTPTMTDIASAANSLGFKIDKDLPNKEAARSLSASLMGDFKSLLSGPTSDSDRKFLLAIPPSEANTAKGRTKILAIAEKAAQRAAQEHEMANKWIVKYGRLTPEFEQQLNYWRRNTSFLSQ